MDLLGERHRSGRRFEPLEFVEEGPRVAVRLRVTDERWGDDAEVEVFKVFTFGEADGPVVLLQDCVDREDALGLLAEQ